MFFPNKMGYMRYRKYYAGRGNSYGGYKKKKSYGGKRYMRKKSSLPSNRGTHQFDFVDNVNQPTNTWFSTGKKQDFCQAQRTYNVSGLLWGIHQTKIFVTGVKLTLSLFRMNSIRSELAAKAVNWRVMLCDSVVFNACEQFNRENLSFSEGMKGSIDGLNVGFTSLNTVGMMTSIHQNLLHPLPFHVSTLLNQKLSPPNPLIAPSTSHSSLLTHAIYYPYPQLISPLILPFFSNI